MSQALRDEQDEEYLMRRIVMDEVLREVGPPRGFPELSEDVLKYCIMKRNS